MTESLYQHYVPRFYLAGWQATVNQRPKRVWVYEQGVEPRHAPVKRIAGDANSSEVIEVVGTPDAEKIERYLSQVESRAAVVVSAYYEKKSELIDVVSQLRQASETLQQPHA